MTQLSAEAKQRTAHAAMLRKPSNEDLRRRGSGRPVKDSDGAGDQPGPLEESISAGSQETDMWEDGRVAARSGNREAAILCFIREAEARSRQGRHGRAAIAFRAAAEQARMRGSSEQYEQLLDQAATAYARAAEGDGLTVEASHQAWISAAKCFLQLQQLDQAASCIEKARQVLHPLPHDREPAKTAT